MQAAKSASKHPSYGLAVLLYHSVLSYLKREEFSGETIAIHLTTKLTSLKRKIELEEAEIATALYARWNLASLTNGIERRREKEGQRKFINF